MLRLFKVTAKVIGAFIMTSYSSLYAVPRETYDRYMQSKNGSTLPAVKSLKLQQINFNKAEKIQNNAPINDEEKKGKSAKVKDKKRRLSTSTTYTDNEDSNQLDDSLSISAIAPPADGSANQGANTADIEEVSTHLNNIREMNNARVNILNRDVNVDGFENVINEDAPNSIHFDTLNDTTLPSRNDASSIPPSSSDIPADIPAETNETAIDEQANTSHEPAASAGVSSNASGDINAIAQEARKAPLPDTDDEQESVTRDIENMANLPPTDINTYASSPVISTNSSITDNISNFTHEADKNIELQKAINKSYISSKKRKKLENAINGIDSDSDSSASKKPEKSIGAITRSKQPKSKAGKNKVIVQYPNTDAVTIDLKKRKRRKEMPENVVPEKKMTTRATKKRKREEEVDQQSKKKRI